MVCSRAAKNREILFARFYNSNIKYVCLVLVNAQPLEIWFMYCLLFCINGGVSHKILILSETLNIIKYYIRLQNFNIQNESCIIIVKSKTQDLIFLWFFCSHLIISFFFTIENIQTLIPQYYKIWSLNYYKIFLCNLYTFHIVWIPL